MPATPSPIPPTLTPVPGFTPETTQRNSAGVPLPSAPGARSVVVTYTPVPPGGTQARSGFVTVSVGDNYFYPDELHVTTGTLVEWRYDGGGGETESTHNVIALDKSFNSGDLNPGTQFSFSVAQLRHPLPKVVILVVGRAEVGFPQGRERWGHTAF